MKDFQIVPFNNKYSNAFLELNKTWIEEYWSLEKADLIDLQNPQKAILEKGGEIFFLIYNQKAIGTAAIIPFNYNKVELAKMTIQKNFRGKGLSKILLEHCINYAKKNQINEIFLISNSQLIVAKRLYKKFGFKETSLDFNKYKRGNYKMVLTL